MQKHTRTHYNINTVYMVLDYCTCIHAGPVYSAGDLPQVSGNIYVVQ